MPGRQTLPYKFAPANHIDDFFEFFEAQQREKPQKPAPFSIEQHAIHREMVEDSHFVKYAPATEINICGILKKWTASAPPVPRALFRAPSPTTNIYQGIVRHSNSLTGRMSFRTLLLPSCWTSSSLCATATS